MNIILTEEQFKVILKEEVASNNIVDRLMGETNPNVIYNVLAKGLQNGQIMWPTVPFLLGKLFSQNPGDNHVTKNNRDLEAEKANIFQKLNNLWNNLSQKNSEVTARMMKDANRFGATMVSDGALSQICKWETRHDFGYKMSRQDLVGYFVRGENRRTYGYGLRTHPNGKYMEDVKKVWTQRELEQLFKEKIAKEVTWVLNWAKKNGITLGQGQLDAMVSAVYNYGRKGFLRTGIPTMIAQNPNDPKIPKVWATISDHRKNMGGLHERRRREASWYQADMRKRS